MISHKREDANQRRSAESRSTAEPAHLAGIPREEIRHTRAAQDWLAEGRLLSRRCGPLAEATTAQIQALPLEHLKSLADALLDFQGPADLAAWLAANC